MCSLKTCSRLNEFKHATLQGRLVKPGGRKRKQILDSTYHLYVLKNECENFDDVKNEAEHFKGIATKRDEELKKVLEEMAHM